MSAGFETKSSDTKKRNRRQAHPAKVASIEAIQQSLVENFGDIKDPRVERTKKHKLTDILVIAILAVIGGAQGWEDIENYGISKQPTTSDHFLTTTTKHGYLIKNPLTFSIKHSVNFL
jgi:hypothetical protein